MPGTFLKDTVMALQELRDIVLVAELRRRGWVVERPAPWMKLGELARRVGRRINSLSRTLARAGGAPGLAIERRLTGAYKGRIVRVRPSPEFFAWLGAKTGAKDERRAA